VGSIQIDVWFCSRPENYSGLHDVRTVGLQGHIPATSPGGTTASRQPVGQVGGDLDSIWRGRPELSL
jgi:hypothetical protein